MLRVIQSSQSTSNSRSAYAVGHAYLVKRIDNFSSCDPISKTDSSQPVHLGEGPQGEDRLSGAMILERVWIFTGVYVFKVSLIHHKQDVIRHSFQEVFKFFAMDNRTGWVVRIRNQD